MNFLICQIFLFDGQISNEFLLKIQIPVELEPAEGFEPTTC